MKKILVTLVVLVSIIAGVVFTLPYILSSDSLRAGLSERVSSISGLTIDLGGPVNFSVFPDLGVVASDVKLAKPDGSLDVAMSKIVASVKFLPLLSGNVEITGLYLTQPVIKVLEIEGQEVVEDTAPSKDKTIDPFASAVEQLEKLSLQSFTISDGKFSSTSLDGTHTLVENINVQLSAPSLDGEISLSLAATIEGRDIALSSNIAALRPLLQRAPSRVDMALNMDPSPHPLLKEIKASGIILLGADGTYQISDGLFTSSGQPLRLDALYRPGSRPYASLSLNAKSVNLSNVETSPPNTPSKNPAAKTENSNPQSSAPDFTFARDFDADISVKIDSLVIDNIEAREIDLNLNLKNGVLNADLGNARIADGSIAIVLATDFSPDMPVTRGTLIASSLAVEKLARLAKVSSPVSGNLAMKTSYAFIGLSPATIPNSFNIAGGVDFLNGTVLLPQLKNISASATKITDLNFSANIKSTQKPIEIQGNLNWNGEAINYSARIAPHEILKSDTGPLKFNVKSAKFQTDFSGEVDLNGSAFGKLKFSTGSLGQLLAWVGQGENPDLKAFSFAGEFGANNKRARFEDARISFNDITTTGSGSLDYSGKPNVKTNLSFNAIDFKQLVGGDGKSEKEKPSTQSSSKDTPIDLSVLRSFDAEIDLRAKKISYGKLFGGPAKIRLTVDKGVANFSMSKVRFYSGRVRAQVTADGSGAIPKFKIDAKVASVNALPLLSDAADFKRLEGKLHASLSITGTGATTRKMTQSLNGNTEMSFRNGAIRGISIAKIYNNLAALLAGGFKENSEDKTTFTELGLSFDIKNGIASTDDIRLLGPLVRMDGAGDIDLVEETISMRLNPLVVGSASGQGGVFDVGGVGIPIIIQGPLAGPRVYPDLANLMKNPQAALQSLSKLGLNLKGIGNIKGGKIENVIGDLISKNSSGGTIAEELAKTVLQGKGADNPISNIMGQFGKMMNPGASLPTSEPPANAGSTKVVDGIPIPVPNPRSQASNPKPTNAPKSIEQEILNQVVPNANNPADDPAKTINNLLNGLLQ